MLRTLHLLAVATCVGIAAASKTNLRIANGTEASYAPRVVQLDNGCAKAQCPYDCDTITCMCAACVGTSGCGKAGQCLNPNNLCLPCKICPVGQCASVQMTASHTRAIVCGACPASWTTGAQTSEPSPEPQAAPVSHVTAESLGGVSLDKCAYYDYSKRGTNDAYSGCDERTAADLFCAKIGFGSAITWTTGHEKAGYIIGSSNTNPDARGVGADVLPNVTCTK